MLIIGSSFSFIFFYSSFFHHRYSPKDRAEIGKYACQYGTAAASRVFSRKMERKVSTASVHSIKTAYLEDVKRKRSADSEDDEVTVLPPKKRGRPFLLGDLDQKVQLYLKKVRDAGGIVSAAIAVAAARGILVSCDRSKLAEFGGHIDLGRHWAYGLLDHMKFVRRKATTAKSKHTPKDFASLKESFLDDVVATVTMENIPMELILNWDQTGIKMVPSSGWTMDRQGAKRVEVSGVNDKRMITAVFCGSLTGDFLPLQLIYKGKTNRCHPRFQFPPDWHITQSPKHWSTEQTMVEYIEEIIIPYIESKRADVGDKPALVIMDNFKGQITSTINSLLEAHDIHVCLLPANTTDLLQPMDISVNKPAKDFLKRKFEAWYSDEVIKQFCGKDIDSVELQPIKLCLAELKVLGAKWLVEMAEYISDNPQFIVNGFRRAGICAALDGYREDDASEREDTEDEDILSEASESDEQSGFFSSDSDD